MEGTPLRDDTAEIERLVREGKLIPFGSEREAFVTRREGMARPRPGDVLPGRFLVTWVDPTPQLGGWDVRVKQLVPPRAAKQR